MTHIYSVNHASNAASEPPETAPVMVDALVARCKTKGHRVYDGDLVTEAAAADLLGYAGPDALRKQIYEGRSHPPFRMRSNRRFYALAGLLPWLPG